MSLSTVLDVDATPDVATFTFTVRNESDDTVDVQFRSAKLADVAVFRGDEEVWRWSDGQLFAQMLQSVSFDPGHVETFEFEWSDPESGEYEAVATLNAVQERSARGSFSV